MLRQVTPVLRNVAKVSRMSVRASSAAGHGHEHHPSDLEVVKKYHNTLNDMPIPEGSWQEDYNKRNSKWNMMLAASVVCFAGTLYAVLNVVEFHTFPMSDMKKVKLNVE